MKSGFNLTFAKSFDYIFKNKVDRNRAMLQVHKALRLAGLTRADFKLREKKGIRKGRGLKAIPFQPKL